MSYLEGLAAAVVAFLLSAGLFVGAGLLDRRLGYESSFKPLCAVFGVMTLILAVVLFVLLLPWLSKLILAICLTGIIFTTLGLVRLLVTDWT